MSNTPFVCCLDTNLFIYLAEITHCRSVADVQNALRHQHNGKTSYISHEKAGFLLQFRNKIYSGEIIPYLPTKVIQEISNPKYITQEEINFRQRYCRTLEVDRSLPPETRRAIEAKLSRAQAMLVSSYLAQGIFNEDRNVNDAIIMAQASTFGIPLVTINEKHFIDSNKIETRGDIRSIVTGVNNNFAQSEYGANLIAEGAVSPAITITSAMSTSWFLYDIYSAEQTNKPNPTNEIAVKYANAILGANIPVDDDVDVPPIG